MHGASNHSATAIDTWHDREGIRTRVFQRLPAKAKAMPKPLYERGIFSL
jgi:hypothetical protein